MEYILFNNIFIFLIDLIIDSLYLINKYINYFKVFVYNLLIFILEKVIIFIREIFLFICNNVTFGVEVI